MELPAVEAPPEVAWLHSARPMAATQRLTGISTSFPVACGAALQNTAPRMAAQTSTGTLIRAYGFASGADPSYGVARAPH